MGNPTPAHGLVTRAKNGGPIFLPLKSVSARVNIVDISARVVVTQIYNNNVPNDTSAAQYIFPIPVNAAVCAFKMETSNGQEIEAVAKELSKAKKEFDTAVANDEWAGLLYQAAGDVFVISLGAIPAYQDIRATIVYVTELDQDKEVAEVRFQFPTYIAERYGSAPPEMSTESSSTASTTFALDINIQMAGIIDGIRSPTHAQDIITLTGQNRRTATVTLDPNRRVALDREFVLVVNAQGLDDVRCLAEVDRTKNSVAVSFSFVPVPDRPIPDLQPHEVVFVIDRSSSMKTDSRIGFAKRALTQLVGNLHENASYFNVVSFGSKYTSLWNSSSKYDNSTKKTAETHIDAMTANYRGTKLDAALDYVIKARQTNMPTSVVILTDGELWESDQQRVFSTVRSAVANAGSFSQGRYLRFFTLGIGESASTALCMGLAEIGHGICYMTTKADEIEKHCARLMLTARKPPLASALGLSINWNYTGTRRLAAPQQSTPAKPLGVTSLFGKKYDYSLESVGAAFKLPPPPDVQQAPSELTNIVLDNRCTISAILADTTTIPRTISLRMRLPDGQSAEAEVPVEGIQYDTPPLLHTLAARRIIRELEGGSIASLGPGVTDGGDPERRNEIIKVAAVKFSEEYQILSKYTAFVAVERDTPPSSYGQYNKSMLSEEREFEMKRFASQRNNAQNLFTAQFLKMSPASTDTTAIPRKGGSYKVSSDDAVTPFARLQHVDGSFVLDDSLVTLLSKTNNRISLQLLTANVPSSLQGLRYADTNVVWATVLASAYWKIKLSDERDIWQGLFDKAMRYVMDAITCGSFIFSQLIDEAAKVLG